MLSFPSRQRGALWLPVLCGYQAIVLAAALIAALALGGTHKALASSPPDSPAAPPGGPVDHGLNVFVCGHSFHVGVAGVLQQVSKAAGLNDPRVAGVQFIGGSRVLQHWQLPDQKNKAKTALRAGKVDVLTLSSHLKLPDEGIDLFTELALLSNPNVRVTVQQSWLPWDNPQGLRPAKAPDRNAITAEALLRLHADHFRELAAQVQASNTKLGRQAVFLVPVGQSVIALREKIRLGQAPGVSRQDDIFRDEMGHPAAVLDLLNAYCHFAVIYRRSPVGLPVPPAMASLPQGAQSPLNTLLQEIAWGAVSCNPLCLPPSAPSSGPAASQPSSQPATQTPAQTNGAVNTGFVRKPYRLANGTEHMPCTVSVQQQPKTHHGVPLNN